MTGIMPQEEMPLRLMVCQRWADGRASASRPGHWSGDDLIRIALRRQRPGRGEWHPASQCRSLAIHRFASRRTSEQTDRCHSLRPLFADHIIPNRERPCAPWECRQIICCRRGVRPSA